MSIPDFQLFTSLRYDPLLKPISQNTSSWPLPTPLNGSPFYMLPYHRDRMLEAADHFGWEAASSKIRGSTGFSHLLQKLNEAIDFTSSAPLRVRILLNHEGVTTVETNPTSAVTECNLFPTRLPPPKSSTPAMDVSPLTGGALMVGEGHSVHGDPPTEAPWDVYVDTHLTPASGFTSFKTTNRHMYSSARERVGIHDMAEKKEVLIIGEGNEIMEGSLTTVIFWRDGKWVTPPVTSGGQIGTTRRWALEKGLVVEAVVQKDELKDGEECWFSNGVRGFQWGKVRLVSSDDGALDNISNQIRCR